MEEKIYFYYTNDLHSDFTYWPQVVAYFNQGIEQRKRNEESYFVVDIGDHVDRVHPIAEAFMGKANVQLLNDAEYDIVTLGNNEGITLAHHELYHLYDEAQFDVVCTNLQSQTENNPNWLKASVHIQSIHGVNIGVIGLTAPFNAFYNLLHWHASDPYEVLEQHIDHLQKDTDIIVLLSHLGITEDQQIAEQFPEIDVIIGGHTHHLLKTGEKVNNTLLTAAGKHCAHVGEVIITWDHEHNQIIQSEAYAVNVTQLQPDRHTKQMLSHLQDVGQEKLATPIIQVQEPFRVKWFQETTIIKKLTNTLKEWTKADCAMLNAGLLLDDLHAGKITYEDVHRICPHPINPVVVELTGAELKEVIRVTCSEEFMKSELRGFGFRGEVIGKMIFSHLQFETERDYLKEFYIGGHPIQDQKTYLVATADMFIFGRLLPEIAKSTKKELFLPEFIRELLVYTLRNTV